MLKKIFGSINKTFLIISVISIILAAATLIEKSYDSDFTRKLIYHSWVLWFFVIWGVKTAIYQVFIVRRISIRRIQSIFIHSSFIFIVTGAIITHFFSQEVFLSVRKGEQNNIMLNQYKKPVGNLPFMVKLNDFKVERYGGAGMPSDYTSDITIIEGEKIKEFFVSMNKIASYKNYKLYQSSYDDDEGGVVLLINNDYWGTVITYIGYLFLMLGMLLMFFCRGSRFYDLLGKSMSVLILCFTISTAKAQINEQNIESIATVPVQSVTGRIEPFSVFANDVIQKLYENNNYNGIRNEVIIIEMLGGRDKWKNELIITLPSEHLQKQLNRSGLNVSFKEFFDENGNYVLIDIMNEIYKKKQDKLTSTEKDLLKLDEKLNIMYQLFEQMIPAVIPTGNSSEKWLSMFKNRDIGTTVIGDKFEQLIASLNSNNKEQSSDLIIEFKKIQEQAIAPKNRVSQMRLNCEVWYDKFNLIFIFAIFTITVGVLGIFIFLIGLEKKNRIMSVLENVIKSSVLIGVVLLSSEIAVRWYIAGRAPVSNSYETVVFVAWVLLLCGWLFRKISILVISAISFVAGCLLMIAHVGGLDPQITPLVPVLNSHWLLFHVATIATSYGLFTLSAVMGVIYMIMNIIAPNNKRVNFIATKISLLNELSQLSGVAFITIGIFLGAIWANVSWGRYWGWDPKETWALITMFVYVINTHLFISKKIYSQYLINVLSIFSIGFILMTFFGVNYFFGGMHAYGGEHRLPIFWILLVFFVLVALVIFARIRICQTARKIN